LLFSPKYPGGRTVWQLGRLGRNEEALAAFDKVIEINPVNPQNAVAWYNKGIILNNLGREEDAKIAFENAYELAPKFSVQSS